MKHFRIVTLLLLAIVSSLTAQTSSTLSSQPVAQSVAQKAAPPATIASIADRQIYYAELEIVPAAEAMPEDKYNFAPSGGDEFKGVRTFALQVKHIANMNYLLWSAVLGETPAVNPKMIVDNGPDSIKTKADIVKYLKDSFALGHRAAKFLTAENCVERVVVDEKNSGPRLFWTTFALSHAYDHYGQMVEYLRMNGIVPPASRATTGKLSVPSQRVKEASFLMSPRIWLWHRTAENSPTRG
jgi:hypothetical protein